MRTSGAILILERFFHGAGSTVGRFLLDGRSVYSIERPWLLNQPWESCIPEGEYALRPYSSERFPNVWEVCDVPGRSHILIHAGNWSRDVSGCIAPGMTYRVQSPESTDIACYVGRSREALSVLFSHIARQESPTLKIVSACSRLEN